MRPGRELARCTILVGIQDGKNVSYRRARFEHLTRSLLEVHVPLDLEHQIRELSAKVLTLPRPSAELDEAVGQLKALLKEYFEREKRAS